MGLQAVAEDGPAGVTIDALTARAGKTTGSFYAHFQSMKSFFDALGEYWLEKHTRQLIKSVTTHSTPRDRLGHLNRLAFQLDVNVEQGMRRLAATVEAVSQACEACDRERVAFLAGQYASSGQYDETSASDLARIEYAAFVGLQQTEPYSSPEETMRLYRSFLEMTGR